MGLFNRKSNNGRRCPECRYYVMLEGYGFCAKDAPPDIDLRMLSGAGIRRHCVRCPKEMTCEEWQAR